MSKFKVGDKVIGACTSKQNYVAEGVLYTVLAADVAAGTEFIKTDASNGYWVLAERFYLEDPLPPAPESVLYVGMQENVHRRLKVKVFTSADGRRVVDMHIGGGAIGDGKSCTLDPDAALQLAHDLRRMAMDIKRKEKAQ